MPENTGRIDARGADSAPLLEKLFWFDAEESSYVVQSVEGEVPEWLRGAYYVNGPARFERAGFRYNHWLDGDGMVDSLHFGAEAIRFVSRFVQSTKLKDETAAGKPVYRAFGTAFAGDQLRRRVMLEAPMNVSVYPFAGTLLAFGEQTLPLELDPHTLETKGEYDFGGKLNEVSPFSAHPKFDPGSGNMVNFGISFAARQPMLNVYEFDPDGGLVRRQRCPLPYPVSNHDFALSENYAAFYLSPLVMDFSRFWGEGVSVMESLSWEPERGTFLMVVPRHRKDEEAFSVEIECGHCLHVINSFEDGDQFIFDVIEMDKPVYPEYQPVPELYQTKGEARPVRFIIDIPSRKLVGREGLVNRVGADFPSIAPDLTTKEYQEFWMLGISETGKPGRKFLDQLIHLDWSKPERGDVYQANRGEYFGGEPICLQNPEDSDQSMVIVQHFIPAEDKTEFLLFDAGDVAAGPKVKIPLQHKMHAGFHASFWPE